MAIESTETVDDVIEYIRSLYCHDSVYESETGLEADDFDTIADRLESALKRERLASKK